MKLYSLLFIISFFLVSCSSSQMDSSNQMDNEEWISLFNGKDLSGWTIKMADQDLDENFRETFVVEDDMIRIKYDNYKTFDDAYGHMYYKDPFSYYRLTFDYRFVGEQTEGGATWNVRNSGVMLHSQSAESNDYGQDFPVSIELQLLGGLGDGPRTTGNVCTPGTAVMMGDTINYNHCINSNSATYDGDQWISAEAIVLGGEEMLFLIEGDTVLQFDKPLIGGGFISQAYEGADWENFGVTEDKEQWISRAGEILSEGYISLQAESHPIDFKNIMLLDLCGCMDKKAKNYKSYYVKSDAQKCIY